MNDRIPTIALIIMDRRTEGPFSKSSVFLSHEKNMGGSPGHDWGWESIDPRPPAPWACGSTPRPPTSGRDLGPGGVWKVGSSSSTPLVKLVESRGSNPRLATPSFVNIHKVPSNKAIPRGRRILTTNKILSPVCKKIFNDGNQ